MEKLRMAAGLQEKLEISALEDGAGNPISALTIMSLLERVAGIIDSVQSSQQRMEERQQDLENNIKNIQGDVLKLAKDHASTGSTVDKLLQKTRKVSANVKEVRARVEMQNVRVKKVESTQDELLTRNRFRVVIYQGDAQIPSVTVNKVPKGVGLDGVEVEADSYAAPPDLSSDEEYLSVEEPDATRGARMKKSMMKSTEGLRSAFSKENMVKTRGNIGNKMHNLGEKVVPPERREKMHAAGARLKENIAKHAPTKETFHIKLKKERTVAEGQEGAEGLEGGGEEAAAKEGGAKGRKSPGVAYTEVAEREGPVEEAGATRIAEEEAKE